MVKIVIVGATIKGNQGAAAMLQTVIQTLSKNFKDVRFDVLSYYPKQDKKANKNPNVNILSGTPFNLAFITLPLSVIYKILDVLHLPKCFIKKSRTTNAFFNCDALIDVAGVSFIDGREIYLPYNIACITPAILFKKKIIKYSQAMGPFNNFLNKLCSKMLLPKINIIVARGKNTKKNLDSLKLKNITMLAESTFSLELTKQTIKKISEYKKDNIFKKKVVGISPSSVVENYCIKNNIPYVEIMAKFIDYLNNKGFNTILIPHSYREDTKKKKNNDLMVCKKIFDIIKDKSKCKVIGKGMNPEELRVLIGLTDYFIAARFHAMISSLAMKVPTIVCGWSHKYEEVLEMFNLEDYCFDYKSLKLSTVIDKFEFLIKNEIKVKENIKKNLPNVIDSSDKHIELVKNLLKS